MAARGILYGLVGAFCASLMGRYVHQSANRFNVFEVTVLRNLAMAVLLIPWVFADLARFFGRQGKIIWVRGILGAAGVFLYFQLLQWTEVSNALFLSNLTPVITLGFGGLLLGERLNRSQLGGVCVVLGALGIRSLQEFRGAEIGIVLFAVVVSLVQASAFLLVKRAAGSFSTAMIVFAFCGATVLTSPILPIRWGEIGRAYLSLETWFLVALGLGTQCFMTRSFQTLRAGEATLVAQFAIPFASLVEIYQGERRGTFLDLVAMGLLFIGLARVGQVPWRGVRIRNLTGFLRRSS